MGKEDLELTSAEIGTLWGDNMLLEQLLISSLNIRYL